MKKNQVKVSEEEILSNSNDFELGKLVRIRYYKNLENSKKSWTTKLRKTFLRN